MSLQPRPADRCQAWVRASAYAMPARRCSADARAPLQRPAAGVSAPERAKRRCRSCFDARMPRSLWKELAIPPPSWAKPGLDGKRVAE